MQTLWALTLLLLACPLALGQYAETIAEVLEDADCTDFLEKMNTRGYDTPSLLRRLSNLDMDSLGMQEDDVAR